MGKFATNPILFDEVLKISTTFLKKHGYFGKEQIKTGVITWSRNGSKYASISIKADTTGITHFIELDYKNNGVPINYRIYIEYVPSNLGIGNVPYFICPQTKKRCRILYAIGGYFLHREAFNGCMYENQTHSKYWRMLDDTVGASYQLEKLYEQLYSKHFTRYYKGIETRKYKKLKAKINELEYKSDRQLNISDFLKQIVRKNNSRK